eukprot:1984765-Rhodomonas_salina.1
MTAFVAEEHARMLTLERTAVMRLYTRAQHADKGITFRQPYALMLVLGRDCKGLEGTEVSNLTYGYYYDTHCRAMTGTHWHRVSFRQRNRASFRQRT